MSLREFQARFQRQYLENAAWRLLRAKNAPLILAFISDLFSDSNDVLFSRAKAAPENLNENEKNFLTICKTHCIKIIV